MLKSSVNLYCLMRHHNNYYKCSLVDGVLLGTQCSASLCRDEWKNKMAAAEISPGGEFIHPKTLRSVPYKTSLNEKIAYTIWGRFSALWH